MICFQLTGEKHEKSLHWTFDRTRVYCCSYGVEKSIQSYVLRNRDELTTYARKVIEEHPMEPIEWNGWKVYYYADDEPHGFQNVPVEFVKSENGWSWAESEGDNIQYTERIAAHWYWYEVKF